MDGLNVGKKARIEQLNKQIATEQNVENVLSIRSEIFDIIKVVTSLCTNCISEYILLIGGE